MRKSLLTSLLLGLMAVPAQMQAIPDNDNPPEKGGSNDRHRSPAWKDYAYIAYDGTNCIANVVFCSALDEVAIVIYHNGNIVDHMSFEATEGMVVPVFFSGYGEGSLIIQVVSAATLLTTYSITF